ncbi:MAG: patatin-like phospholipase family protein [Gemmatimonadales bacterium]
MLKSGEFTLVLSGGGMRGLSHIGVFRALEERGLRPSLVVGTSMGALLGGAWAAGMPLGEMHERARRLRRRDVFQIAHADMALRRMRAPAIYRAEPLERLALDVVGQRTFADLPLRLLVNTVDLHSGVQVLWGAPGLDDGRVADAIFASCALPGIFPPREIGGRTFVDGAVVDNLPVRAAAAARRQPILAIDVGASGMIRAEHETSGFAATYMRAFEILMQTLSARNLAAWTEPALVLVRPRVEHVPMFTFDRTPELLEEGFRAVSGAIRDLEAGGGLNGAGIYPKRQMQIMLDGSRCVGCGTCASMAPGVFRMNGGGKAEVVAPRQVWSPIDGGYVLNCPTFAISARAAARTSGH